MAPELLRREAIDERIDIFAFGVMAFEFLTERLPYDATTNAAIMLQRINAEPLDPAVVKPQLSEELCGMLRQLTAKTPRTAMGRDEDPSRSSSQRPGRSGRNDRIAPRRTRELTELRTRRRGSPG